MKIKDNYEAFVSILLDLNSQIGLSLDDIFDELKLYRFDLTKDEFIIETNKLKRICYELNMDMFDKEDRIRNYTEEQYNELIKIIKEINEDIKNN